MHTLSQTRLLSIAAVLTVALVAGCSSPSNQSGSQVPEGSQQSATSSTSVPANSLQVTVTVTGPGVAELALPMNLDGKRQQYADIQTTGTWQHTYNGDRIQSTQVGSTVTLHLPASKPVIPFLESTNGAEVSLKYGNTTRTISLHASKYGWRPETINTPTNAPSPAASAH